MNTVQNRWSKFKQEFFIILYVSITQIWFNFKFPAFIKLGTPLNTMVSLSCSMVTTLCYIIIFSHADLYLAQFKQMQYNQKKCNDAQEDYYIKIIQKALQTTLFLAAHTIFFYIWIYDFYGASNLYYALFYVHCVTIFLLMARAINRQPLLHDADLV